MTSRCKDKSRSNHPLLKALSAGALVSLTFLFVGTVQAKDRAAASPAKSSSVKSTPAPKISAKDTKTFGDFSYYLAQGDPDTDGRPEPGPRAGSPEGPGPDGEDFPGPGRRRPGGPDGPGAGGPAVGGREPRWSPNEGGSIGAGQRVQTRNGRFAERMRQRGGGGGGMMGGGGFGGHRQLDLTSLNLTDEQKQHIHQIRQATREKAKQMRRDLMTKQTNMRNLFFSADATESQIKQARRELRKAQDQMDEINFDDLLQVRNTLTPEQKQKLPGIAPAREGRPDGPRMGGARFDAKTPAQPDKR